MTRCRLTPTCSVNAPLCRLCWFREHALHRSFTAPSRIRSVARARDGSLYVLHAQGLTCIDPGTGMQEVPLPRSALGLPAVPRALWALPWGVVLEWESAAAPSLLQHPLEPPAEFVGNAVEGVADASWSASEQVVWADTALPLMATWNDVRCRDGELRHACSCRDACLVRRAMANVALRTCHWLLATICRVVSRHSAYSRELRPFTQAFRCADDTSCYSVGGARAVAGSAQARPGQSRPGADIRLQTAKTGDPQRPVAAALSRHPALCTQGARSWRGPRCRAR